MNKIMKLSFLA